jgi:DNA sulfur modification protein DndE
MDRIKLTSAARNQLTTIKRRTGIEHNNVICRHALCMSLANPSIPPEETYVFSGGLEIDWKVLTGGKESLYYNLLVTRMSIDSVPINEEQVRMTFTQHVHRGLSYLVSRRDEDLLVGMAGDLSGL